MKQEILGVKIDSLSREEALEIVKQRLDSGEKGYIVTPNPEIVILAQGDERYREILNHAFLSLPDGFGITAAGKILGKSFPERITGVDFVSDLASLADEHSYRLFLLGGEESVAQKAAETLKRDFPRLKIVGAFSGGVLEENREKILKEVQKESVDILVVAFGPPKQEEWIAENLPYLSVKIAIGVGGALDYLAGKKPRAPFWMQKVGLEWFFRLVNEPRRIRRQIKLPVFAFLVLKAKFFKK